MKPFKDRVAIVIGGSSGIGRAIALDLAAQGAVVGLVGRRAAPLETVADEIRASGGAARTCAVDVTADDEVERSLTALKTDLGHLDVLVHSAGAFSMGSLAGASAADFDALYRANLRAPFLLTRLLLPDLQAAGGQIVFINSSTGVRTRAGVGQYSATQHALKALTDTLRAEVNLLGIRVLSVYPGRTATPRQESIHQAEGKPYFPERLLQPEDVAAVVTNALSLRRTAEVTDIHIRPFTKSG